jgi:hypothetical protein
MNSAYRCIAGMDHTANLPAWGGSFRGIYFSESKTRDGRSTLSRTNLQSGQGARY